MAQWPDRPWRAVWPNPVTGAEALFIASHAFAIEGMGLEEGQDLIERGNRILHPARICLFPSMVRGRRSDLGRKGDIAPRSALALWRSTHAEKHLLFGDTG